MCYTYERKGDYFSSCRRVRASRHWGRHATGCRVVAVVPDVLERLAVRCREFRTIEGDGLADVPVVGSA